MGRLFSFFFVASVVLLGCSAGESDDSPDYCDPAEPADEYDFVADSLPVNIYGNTMNSVDLNRKDGFSVAGTLYAYFEGPLSDLLRSSSELAESVTENNDTLIVHAASGELLPHFIGGEVAADGTGRQLLLLRPIEKNNQLFPSKCRGLKNV